MKDLYFEKNYGRLYEVIENGQCKVFEFDHPLGHVRHQFIRREIPIPATGGPYFDIVTPYGYGGPVIKKCAEDRKAELVEMFEQAFGEYCAEHGIVSEFVRFHPVLGNALDFEDCYEVQYLRETVGTSLAAYEDPVQSEFSKSTRKNIRKALEAGVVYEIIESPKSLGEFKEIYHETMSRNNADAYYYFEEEYFTECLKYFADRIVLTKAIFEGQVIGMGLNFTYDDRIHTHLSGTLSDYSHAYPAYVLQYALTVWGKANGYRLIHDGGGRTNDPNDNLLMFKRQFGKNTRFDFYIGKKIWNKPAYQKLCELNAADAATEYFPAYRCKKHLEASRV
ncbi:GNAT family N-acetyltransferase [Planococcus maritimus]|nr:GNAT family N-acetyltransferase [Planococcus sp. SK3692]MDE4085980.1 GNAT family N-acetyltransferase [Planococcus maritimus]